MVPKLAGVSTPHNKAMWKFDTICVVLCGDLANGVCPLNSQKTFQSRHYCLRIGWGYFQQRANVGMPPISRVHIPNIVVILRYFPSLWEHSNDVILSRLKLHNLGTCDKPTAMDKISVDESNLLYV